MLTIYGVYRSRASRNYWMAEELGIPFKSVPVIQARRLDEPLAPSTQINTLSPEFLAINPMGQIPSITDGDFVMHESLAINLYLARKHGGPLGGQTAEEDGLLSMWTIFAATELEPHSIRIVQTYDAGEEGTDAGRATIAVASRLLKRPLDVLEKHLSGIGNFVGNGFTVADLNVAEVLRYAQTEADLFDKRPALKAWIERCQSRPAFLAMMAKRSAE